MGRKKIEIRPLVDERNRNVTFLKRKAGLMKKAWELSVLCAADVSIVIFSAAGKAYEFSSRELESELDRYYDYEGMIERRRAPEFAAMALAGEDDDDDDDDAGPSRRDSVSKGKNNGSSSAAGAANGGTAPQPRSLKGKETFKAKTVRHGHESSSRRKGKKKRSKSRSASEKRSFIDSILSGESSEDSDSDDREEDTRRRRKDDYQQQQHERDRDRRREKERDRKARRGSDVDRTRDRAVERAYGTSDKMIAGLQYALNMHSAPSATTSSSDPRYASQYASQSRDTYARDPQVNPADVYSNSNHAASLSVPVNVPQLPRLPSDGAPYRLPHSIGHAGPSSQAGLSAGLTYSPGLPPSSAQFMQTHPHGHLSSQDGLHHSLGGSAGFASVAGPVPPTAPPGFQWDRDMIARYAEFQLQQNHQRQQRILLEKQRQQLAYLGVPLDDRSLLDEIFGGMSSSGGAGGGGGGSGSGNAGRAEYIPLDDSQNLGGAGASTSGEFIWPLAGSSNSGNRTSTMDTPLDEGLTGPGGSYDFPSAAQSQSQAQSYSQGHGQGSLNGSQQGGQGHGDWSFEVFDQSDGGGSREGMSMAMSLPSPVSASNGEVRRKGRGRDYEDEGIPKRMRVQ
ncbi:hypothetical protein IAU59_006114 [Kwoniella sp. CBS 9459]